MWLLECDDYEMLKGTRMWLRPGSRCVLGRVKQDDGNTLFPHLAAGAVAAADTRLQ
jgi:hypothetical protein